ncbi:MAG: NAD-dependent epimerase/dehydratase family protein [Myxococcales bacterium]|nr:NAD-dependent epimerase/dehydratase family protein [Myxococcales bacterium]
MRVLVTGATGFLGTHLVPLLREAGHELVLVARSVDGLPSGPGITLMGADVLDAAAMKRAAAGCQLAIHAAGHVSRRPEDAESLYRVHVDGTKTVLDACRAAGVKRVVYVSTSGTVAVSDDPDAIATENDDAPIGIVQRWPYYRAKLFAEQAALERNVTGEFEVVSINPALLLGPGDLRGSSTEDVRLFLDGKIPATPPGGLSFVDVRDAARAVVLALEKGEPGQRYLLGACNLTLKEFFGKLERVSGVKAPRLHAPRAPELTRLGVRALTRLADRIGAKMPVDEVSVDMASFYWYLDSARAEHVLGFSSRDPVATLDDTVADLRARGVVWPEPPRA